MTNDKMIRSVYLQRHLTPISRTRVVLDLRVVVIPRDQLANEAPYLLAQPESLTLAELKPRDYCSRGETRTDVSSVFPS